MRTFITSSSNPLYKKVKKLIQLKKYRYQENSFIIEGRRICREIPSHLVAAILVSESYEARGDDFLIGREYCVLSDELFSKLSDTVTSQGMMVVAKMPPSYFYKDLLKEEGHYIVLEDIQDPGNLGTIIRTAEAAGIGGLILTQNTVDIYSPKVVRSTMGSLFRVPISLQNDSFSLIEYAKSLKINIFATSLEDSKDFREVNYGEKSLIFMGNEGNGLKKETLEQIANKIHIPMLGEVESLNLAVATSLVMYETKRKR